MAIKADFHGSDLDKISTYYNISPSSIINFGANVNPLGLSPMVENELKNSLHILTTYPDRNYSELKASIGSYCQTNVEHIIVGNGSTELISLLIQQSHPKKALLLGPTYSEYERELSLIGCQLYTYNLSSINDFQLNLGYLYEQLDQQIDLLIICNPNNPTSSILHQSELEQLLYFCNSRNIFVMIDETYIEFATDINAATAIPLTNTYDNLMVLRGVSKFFSAPGLRLGYGITSNTSFLSQMLAHQNPWSLSSIGALAGTLMLNDFDYIKRTNTLISSQRDRIYKELKTWTTIKVFAPTANFILLQILKPELTSRFVFEYLIKKGFMIRDCSSFHGLDGEFIRFCFMLPNDNDLLLAALKEIL